MSATVKVPYTIVFRHPEAQPPVLLSGSFTTPAWLELEMEASVDDHGEHAFRATVLVEPGRDHQFKFKVGDVGGAWTVDESKPVAEDETGRRTNFMNVPLEHARGQSQELPAGIPGMTQPEPDPLDDVAVVAAEVADAAEKIDSDGTSPSQVSASGGESENEDDLRTPLFAHECFGAYAFVDDGLDHDSLESHQRRDSRIKSIDHAIEQPDLNDPTLEKFPSNRSSVLDTLRKIQSSLGEDQVHIDDPGLRRGSADLADESVYSAVSSSPKTTRKREKRHRSLASLGSIAE